MNLYILVDLEGTSGVCTKDQVLPDAPKKQFDALMIYHCTADKSHIRFVSSSLNAVYFPLRQEIPE